MDMMHSHIDNTTLTNSNEQRDQDSAISGARESSTPTIRVKFTCYQCNFERINSKTIPACPQCHSEFCSNQPMERRFLNRRSAAPYAPGPRQPLARSRTSRPVESSGRSSPEDRSGLYIDRFGAIINPQQVIEWQLRRIPKQIPKPVSKNFNIPIRKPKEAEIGEKCAICFEKVHGNDEISALDNCEHSYHHNCIKTWAQTKNCCPQCQKTAFSEKE